MAGRMNRTNAATAAGVERQVLRDAVRRGNAEDLKGVCDRPLPGRPLALSEANLALLFYRICRGPDPETDGVGAWTLTDLRRWIDARFDERLTPQSQSLMPRRFSRRKTRPVHPKRDEAEQRRLDKGASAARSRQRPRRSPASEAGWVSRTAGGSWIGIK
jgi:hypothetical protein